MRYNKKRYHRGHKFRGKRFKFRNNHNSSHKKFNRNPIQTKPIQDKRMKTNLFDRITLRYKLLIGLVILNILTLLFFNQMFVFVIFLDIIFVIVYLWGWTNACPRCHSHWAKSLVDRTHFGTHTEFENVNRTMTHKDSRGNVIGTSSVRDTRPVTMHTIQNHWTCKFCRYSWSGRIHDTR